MGAGPGPKAEVDRGATFFFAFPKVEAMRGGWIEGTRLTMLKPILLVEDNPNDIELTLVALGRSQLANDVIVARDGADALDYLRCQGEYKDRPRGNPAVVLLDLKLPKVDGHEVLHQLKTDPDLRVDSRWLF